MKRLWAVVVLAACKTAPAPVVPDPSNVVELRGPAMGTEVQVVIRAEPAEKEKAEATALAALNEIKRIEAMMTDWDDASDLSAVNKAAGDRPIHAPAELLELLATSKQISELTHGAFDVTYAGAGQFWDFKARPPHIPDAGTIADAIRFIDYRKLEVDLDAGTAFLPMKGMKIGLGGIAKGYAVDRASALIKAAGFKHHAIKAGGDMKISGRWNHKLWSVAIRDPRDRDGVVAVLPVANTALSTSGDYERYFELDGVRYAHILDPRTGWPVQHVRSVTIVARDAVITDGLAKGVFVLGPVEGLKLAEDLPEVEAVVIDGDGNLTMTSGLSR